MKRLRALLYLFVLAAFTPCLAFGQASRVAQSDITTVQLLSEKSAIMPGKPFWVGLRIVMKPHWHTYKEPPGDSGLAPTIRWELPPGFSASDIRWPAHKTFIEGILTTYGYDGEVIYPVQITPPDSIINGKKYELTAHADWLVCNDICIPEKATLNLTLSGERGLAHDTEHAESILSYVASVTGATKLPVPAKAETSAPSRVMGYASALYLALLGGILLNLMPCVFPVLSLKCLSIARQHGASRAHARWEGLAYTAGILLSFAGIAGALIALRASGEAIGWGYQMQSPVFVAALALLMFLIGLSLSGLFSLPVLLGNAGGGVARAGLRGSFFTGVLATFVATPCTAPLMAPAIGYALTQPPVAAFLIFEMLALGLALPFLLISFFPVLTRAMPRPGQWMETFKQLLAFPMYASAIWLVWVLAQQAGANGVGAVLLAMLAFAFALWLRRGRWLVLILIVAGAAGALWYVRALPPAQSAGLAAEDGATPFSEALLANLRKENTPVFVDATAAWCITCRVNHFSTLKNEAVMRTFKEKNVRLLVADWTNKDAEITEYLASFGYNGVPMYVYYAPGQEPVLLPQVLTPAIVLDAVRR